MTKILAILIVFFLSHPAHAQWLTHTLPGRVELVYSPGATGSFPSASAALKHVPNSGKLNRLEIVVGLTGLLQEPAFQKEIFFCLSNIAPKELKAALSAKGNRDPHMVAIAGLLPEALRCTPTIQKISNDIAPFGLQFEHLFAEKVSLVNHGEQRAFHFSFTASVRHSAARPNNSFKPKPLRGSA